MRVAIVTDSYFPTRDGVATQVLTTKECLDRMGHEVIIVAPDPGEKDREEGIIYVPSKPFKSYEGYFLPTFRHNELKEVEDWNPDIIHLHGCTVMTMKGLVTSHFSGIPTVQTFVTMVNEVAYQYSPIKLPPNFLNKLVQIYLRQELKRPNALVVPTPSIAKELLEMGVKPKRMEIIPVGVDIDRFVKNDKGDEIRERHGLVGKKVLITVGRLSFEKKVDLLISSMKHLDDDIALLICGKGPAGDEWRQLAVDEGVTDKVVFAGFVPDDDLVSYYSCADLFITASKFETQGLTTLEAMACEVPALCANGRAFTDVIQDGENGYLFETTEEDCVRVIRQGLENIDKLKAGARKTAETYSIQGTADALEKLYQEVVEEKKRKQSS
ncbi:MAG: glycosyltransferase [Candidatus Methanomethylophilaceae archaeon]|nr:glycosyltransferase [Candidatus Methanomethylophilaceae archaeon]